MAAEPAFRVFPNDDQLLVRATELVERGWSRTALAEDREGRQVEPWSEQASRWSPLGALISAWHEGGGGRIEEFDTAVRALSLATGGRTAEWNAVPWRTKWHVLSAFERARQYLPEARALRTDDPGA
jgi:hypothetical protein